MKKLICLWSLLCAVSLYAQLYPVYQLPCMPNLDGKLQDEAWSRLPEGRGFHTLHKGNPYVVGRTTRFKMGHLNNCLYLAVECREPNLKQLVTVRDFRDGYVLNDAIELFFQRTGHKNFMQLLANAAGARWAHYQGEERETEPPADWIVAAGRTERGWTLEMSIPASLLRVQTLADMSFNIARTTPREEQLHLQCWSRAMYRFGDTLAKMKIVAGPPPIPLAPSEHRLNQDYDCFLKAKLQDLKTYGRAWMDIKQKLGSHEQFDKLLAIQQEINASLPNLSPNAYPELYNRWEETRQQLSTPQRKLTFSINGNSALQPTITIGGKIIVSNNGNYTFTLQEGVNVLTCTVNANEKSSLNINFPEYPILNKRWAYTTQKPADTWTDSNYDDRTWETFNGTIPAGKTYLRQLILWNKTHTGTMRCINPTMKTWNFSLNSMEPLYLSVYSPTGLHVKSFDFTLTLPKGFHLMDMRVKKYNRCNLAPLAIQSTQTLQGTQHTLTYKPQDVHEWKTADAIIGIRKDNTGKAGDKGTIPYARLINSNVTEIAGELPYSILPPINGKQLKHMLMTMYMGFMPQALSMDMLHTVYRETIKAGMDKFMLFPLWTPKSIRRDKIIRQYGGDIMLTYNDHPIRGAEIRHGAVRKMFMEDPELFCLQFNGVRRHADMKIKRFSRNGYVACPSRLLEIYPNRFYRAIQSDYLNIQGNYDDLKYVFLNWENDPWDCTVYEKNKNPSGAFCFCSRCKENFRKWAGISPKVTLDNQTILTKYYETWRKFRYTQDAAIHKITCKALNDIGKQVYFYSWSNHWGYWEAAKENPYLVFLGCPGNPVADRRQQIIMDKRYLKFHRETCGRRQMAGQRFIFWPNTYCWNYNHKNGWLHYPVTTDNGLLHPKSWKWQVVRVLATLQGGLDLQNPLEMVSGIKYYVGEATRMVAHFEDIFYYGKREDSLAQSSDIAYPDMLVLTRPNERLLLLFNEGTMPKKVTVNNLHLAPQAKAHAYYQNLPLNAKTFTLTIPPDDVEAVYIH